MIFTRHHKQRQMTPVHPNAYTQHFRAIPESLSTVPRLGPPIPPLDQTARPQPTYAADGSALVAPRIAIDCATGGTTGRQIAIDCAAKDRPDQAIAIDCASSWGVQCAHDDLSDEAADLLRRSIAPASERALRSDLAQFHEWGGTIPASPNMICAYIGDHAGQHAVATIQRRIASISKAHEMAGVPNPCRAEIVKATLRGLRRAHGTAQRQAKPLLRDDLLLVLDSLGNTMRDHRDRALLLLGFAGGFRRSELVGLNCADLEAARQGLIVTIRRSKTDQEGAGRRIGIPHGRTRHCPVGALEAWLAIAGIEQGPLFRPVNRHGHVAKSALTGEAVSVVIRERLAATGIDPDGYSGHSLRAGFATSAAQAGVSTLKIRAQTGHASDAMLARYVRDGDMFTGNAAGAVL